MLMPTHRETHYSLLFIFLGVIAALGSLVAKTGLSAESIWFLVIGAIGFLINRVSSNAGLTQLFDIVVGAILGLAGLAGILLQFKVLHTANLPSSLVHTSGGTVQLAGLDIAFFQSLVYAYLGLTSLRHGFAPEKKK
jgi:uncharacterized membrane protein